MLNDWERQIAMPAAHSRKAQPGLNLPMKTNGASTMSCLDSNSLMQAKSQVKPGLVPVATKVTPTIADIIIILLMLLTLK